VSLESTDRVWHNRDGKLVKFVPESEFDRLECALIQVRSRLKEGDVAGALVTAEGALPE